MGLDVLMYVGAFFGCRSYTMSWRSTLNMIFSITNYLELHSAILCGVCILCMWH